MPLICFVVLVYYQHFIIISVVTVAIVSEMAH